MGQRNDCISLGVELGFIELDDLEDGEILCAESGIVIIRAFGEHC